MRTYKVRGMVAWRGIERKVFGGLEAYSFSAILLIIKSQTPLKFPWQKESTKHDEV